MKIYEVEFKSTREGFRLLQHVRADSPEEAEAVVAATQKKELLGTTVFREATAEEEAEYRATKAIADVRAEI